MERLEKISRIISDFIDLVEVSLRRKVERRIWEILVKTYIGLGGRVLERVGYEESGRIGEGDVMERVG